MVTTPPPADRDSRRLVDVLRALPQNELQALVERLRLFVDPQKRLDPQTQIARALVGLPEVRDTNLLPSVSRELLHRIAEAHGILEVPAVPPALEPLLARGIVYARRGSKGQIELLLPSAFIVQIRTWTGEDPRGIRALLAQASFETCSAVASHYAGRPAMPPIALALETAWHSLSTPALLTQEIERLSSVERKLLEAIEREGGEVDTEELLDLEREPMRLRTATGATPSRRGAAFALERRGFLMPIHPNRHVVPTEVSQIIGASTIAERLVRRKAVKASVRGGDYLPRRARFAEDPGPIVMAMAVAVREPGSELRASVGTPRSLLARLSQRFGREQERVAFLAALSRSAGLWDASSLSAASPPGVWKLGNLAPILFDIWRRGGAWDEARSDGEVFRLAIEGRDISPIGVLREMLLDSLRDLGEGRWVPWSALATYIRDDARTAGVARLLRKWAERVNIEAPNPIDVVRRMVFESLPGLGVLDVGDPDESADHGDSSPALRLTPRGRALVNSARPPGDESQSRFLDQHVLRLGSATTVASVLALGPLVDIGKVGTELDLMLTNTALARALSSGIESDLIRRRIEAVAPLPESISQMLSKASAVVGRASYVACAGFLWTDDESVRELLRTRRQTADLFVDPSPSGGLLLATGLDIDKLVRRCRALGVEVIQDGEVLRAGVSTPAPPAVSGVRRAKSSGTIRGAGVKES